MSICVWVLHWIICSLTIQRKLLTWWTSDCDYKFCVRYCICQCTGILHSRYSEQLWFFSLQCPSWEFPFSLLELLLEYGAHAWISDAWKETALHAACRGRHTQVALAILHMGSTTPDLINLQRKDGKTWVILTSISFEFYFMHLWNWWKWLLQIPLLDVIGEC